MAQSPKQPLIETTDLVKKFGAFTALNGVSLKVYPGEVHALLGDNGAGKSTLLKVLSKDIETSGGSMAFDKDIRMGFLRQDIDFVAGRTILEEAYQAFVEIKEIEVKEPVSFIPVTEVNQDGIVKYSLEDYLEKENELTATAKVEEVKEPVDEELNFSFKNLATRNEDVKANYDENISPLDMSIEDSLNLESEGLNEIMDETKDTKEILHTYIDSLETKVDKVQVKRLIDELYVEAQSI